MKKLISLFAAMAMMLSVTSAFAADPITTANPSVMKITCTEIEDFSDYEEDYEDYVDYVQEGWSTYSIKFSIINSPSEATKTSTKYTGNAFNYLSARLDVEPSSTDAAYEDDFIFVDLDEQLIASPADGAYIFNPKSDSKVIYKATTTLGETIEDMFEILLFVNDAYTYEITIPAASVGTGLFENSSSVTAGTNVTYSMENGLLKLDNSCKDGFTLGTPAGPVIGNTTVNESPKTDNYADYTNEDGKACYTQGFKATVAVSGNTGAAYNAYDAVITAKKGDATETKTVPGLTFVSGTTVQNGNVVVKLNVQYVPDGVTLTLDSITPVVK